MEDRWNYCALLSDKVSYKHSNWYDSVYSMCPCMCQACAHVIYTVNNARTAYTKVLTVVLSKGHNSGNFNFLLFVFWPHTNLFWKNDQTFQRITVP